MILSKKELKYCLKIERDIYLPKDRCIEWILTADNHYKIYRYVKLLRYTEYHYNNKSKINHKLLYALYRRRKNIFVML